MKLEQFAMERMQSTYENQVAFNLSESGVHPLRLGELVDDAASREALMAEGLRYIQSNGTAPLRQAIAGLYAGATTDHIQVTNGGSEANYITTWNLVEPDDEVVMMAPNYMQTWGLTRAFGATIREWPLVDAGGRWQIDCDALERLVTPRTKLIIICNPNNPTGARFGDVDLDRIAAIAARHGSWILSDEIYRGAERDGHETPTMWGRGERVIVTSGLSKAYGLPGLRVGWVVGPPPLIAALWSYHDYTTISPGALSDALARRALEPARRATILARTRGILNHNYPIIAQWLDARSTLFSYAAPDAGAIVYVRYQHAINSTDLVNRLRRDKSVLIVPGDHFGMDGYLRIGFGDEPDYLREGLNRLHAMLTEMRDDFVTFDLLLIGYGNVAKRFAALLDEQRDRLARCHGIRTRVIGIATRREGPRYVRASNVVSGFSRTRPGPPKGGHYNGPTVEFIRDACRRDRAAAREGRLVVVETTTLDIARGQPAIAHARAALAGGAHVITANKGPAAFAYKALDSAARKAKRRFLFEGAVMDGIPIFNLVRESLPAVSVNGFRGVVNSTTNYVLTAMEQGETFDAALTRMQAAGIAEADASLDVDGWDAAAKTAALANVLLGASLTPHAVDRCGISQATGPKAIAARAKGRRIKLVAEAHREGRRIVASVRPMELPGDDLLAGLEGQQNAIILKTDLLDEIAIVQRGGSLTQTAYALVSDLVTIARDVGHGRRRR